MGVLSFFSIAERDQAVFSDAWNAHHRTDFLAADRHFQQRCHVSDTTPDALFQWGLSQQFRGDVRALETLTQAWERAQERDWEQQDCSRNGRSLSLTICCRLMVCSRDFGDPTKYEQFRQRAIQETLTNSEFAEYPIELLLEQNLASENQLREWRSEGALHSAEIQFEVLRSLALQSDSSASVRRWRDCLKFALKAGHFFGALNAAEKLSESLLGQGHYQAGLRTLGDVQDLATLLDLRPQADNAQRCTQRLKSAMQRTRLHAWLN